MIFHENRLPEYHTLFLRKLEKMSQHLSSAAVVIDTLRVNNVRSPVLSVKYHLHFFFYKPNVLGTLFSTFNCLHSFKLRSMFTDLAYIVLRKQITNTFKTLKGLPLLFSTGLYSTFIQLTVCYMHALHFHFFQFGL